MGASIRSRSRASSEPGPSAPVTGPERTGPRHASLARKYAWFCGIFLLLQGASTLAARLIPGVDRAFPLLLRATRMEPAHSTLHIATALLAFAVLGIGDRAAGWFALLFGTFYAGLGFLGLATGHSMGLGLQAFAMTAAAAPRGRHRIAESRR
jgi:hypothetical protein